MEAACPAGHEARPEVAGVPLGVGAAHEEAQGAPLRCPGVRGAPRGRQEEDEVHQGCLGARGGVEGKMMIFGSASCIIQRRAPESEVPRKQF